MPSNTCTGVRPESRGLRAFGYSHACVRAAKEGHCHKCTGTELPLTKKTEGDSETERGNKSGGAIACAPGLSGRGEATDGCRCRGRCHQSICGPAVGRGEQAGSVMGPAETAARHRDSPRAARSARALESSPARKGGNGGRRDGVQEERAASRRQERTAMSPPRPCPLSLRLSLRRCASASLSPSLRLRVAL